MAKAQYVQEPYDLEAESLGHIQGITLSNTNGDAVVHYFGGLPYALPPLGPYRFRRPRPLPSYYRYGTRARPGCFAGGSAHCPQPGYLKPPDQTLWDEDCLQLNISIPANRAPPSAKGWPVFVFIHGGFLQWGDANIAPSAQAQLLSETAFDAIIVMPAYRVNAFGFLAGAELQAEAAHDGHAAGNMGFWDQRMALEWTSRHIGAFGGDAANITVGGYSAGSHSTFHQLAHELYFVPDDRAIIRRAIMWSNSPGVQPRTAAAQQQQFDELLAALGIAASTSAGEKLRALREIPAAEIVRVQDGLQRSEFRATTDGAFVARDLIARISSGDFARRMRARGVTLMNGETRDEHFVYRSWRTPTPSFDAVLTRLAADYPAAKVRQLLEHRCGPTRRLPAGVEDWQDLFGRVYADMQVRHLERGFHRALADGGLEFGRDVLRYRFDWRASSVKSPPVEWGVTHGTDMAIWFWGLDGAFSEADKKAARPFNEIFAAFVKGEGVPVGRRPAGVKQMLRLRSDGETDIWVDDCWEEGLKTWDIVNGNDGSGLVGWIRARL